LLRRVGALLRPAGGRVLAEVDPPGAGTRREHVRLELDARRSAWFAWASVDADAIAGAAAAAGLELEHLTEREGRWLAVLAA
ncbi:MAG: SAM-dependent methyltransferase, partial [Actinobacteria bacterium]|nr:SAM-dependent methyltransferase [Actinomycetota bacterium]